jgi:hypothetical protein
LATETPVRKGLPGSRWESVVKSGSLETPLVLAGLLLAAFVIRFVLAQRIVTPWIMIDELIYSELAKNFAGGGQFLLRDAASPIYNVAYPALISPAWLAEPIGTAYDLARTINVALMVLAAVPVYLWGKRLMSAAYALIPAALVLLMPGLTYTGMLMTENAFFTALVTAFFTIALTLERPTLLRQALTLLAIGVTFAVRAQGLVLLPIYAAALALKLVFDLRTPGGPRGHAYVLAELRRFLASALAIFLIGGGYTLFKTFQGAGLETGLGAYAGVVKVDYDFSNATSWVVDHFAEIGLSVAVVPLSALIVLFGLSVRGWESSAAERAFVAVAASGFLLVVVQVGVYASRFSLRIEERNMFGVAPLLFLALGLWLARGLPRPVVWTAVAALVPALLLLSLDLASLLNIGILSDTFGLIPLLRLSGQMGGGVDTVEVLMWTGGFAAGLAFAALPRRIAKVGLPLGVATLLFMSSYSVFGAIRDHARATRAFTGASDPSWIDERVGADADAAFLYGGTADLFGEAQIMWQTEFWNRSVGTVYALGPPEPATLSESKATFDAATGRIVSGPGGQGPPHGYVVAPTSVRLDGRMLEQQGRLALYRIDPPLRLSSLLGGVHADSWIGSDAALTHYAMPSRAGRVQVRISREGWTGPSPPGHVMVRIGPLVAQNGAPTIGKVTSSRTFTIRNGAARSFALPTPESPYRLEIHVEPTFSPADYGYGDTRQLGAQLLLAPSLTP